MRRLVLLGALACVSALFTIVAIVETPNALSRESAASSPDYGQIFAQVLPATGKAKTLIAISEPSWCTPCRRMEPIFDRLKKNGYTVKVMTKDEYMQTSKPQKIHSFPTMLFLRGDKTIDRLTGVRSYKSITERLESDDD